MDEEIKAFAEKVQPIYAMLGWTWDNDTVKGVPSVEDIVQTIRSLAEHILSDRLMTGGLFVQRDTDSGLVYGMEIRGGVYHT